jgi:divalent metal cation (Fe/Co/Zn/Cd) transporter
MESSPQETATQDNKVRSIRQADLVVSTLMIIGGLWFAYDSLMIIIETVNSGHATISTSPGLLPFIISMLIVITSISVLRNAIRSGARPTFLRLKVIREWAGSFDNWTPLVVMAYFVIYVFGLIGRVPFVFATIAFGITMMVTFKATKLIWILLINICYVTFVIYCFTNFAYTKFPMNLFF